MNSLINSLISFAAGVIPASEIDNLPNANQDAVAEVVRLASVFGAVIAVIVVIVAGIQFTLSGGDPGKVATARNAIIYALVGLAICVFAITITSFVIGKVGGA